MPLIYNGQEAGNDKRLEFFERDPIVWREHPHGRAVPRAVRAQADQHRPVERAWGARMIDVPNSASESASSVSSGSNEQDKVFAVFNFSPTAVSVTFGESLCHGEYSEFRGDAVTIDADTLMALPPWACRVLFKE